MESPCVQVRSDRKLSPFPSFRRGTPLRMQVPRSSSNTLSPLRKNGISNEIMTICKGCGKEMLQGALSCPACGETTEKLKEQGIDLYWGKKAPVIGSSIVVKQLTIALGIGFLFVLFILFIISPTAAMAAAPIIVAVFLFMLVMGLIIAAAIQFFTRGGPYMEYAVTRKGVGYRAGDELKALNTLTLFGSAIGGSLRALGAASSIAPARWTSWNGVRFGA